MPTNALLQDGCACAHYQPEEFSQQIRQEYERWGKVVKASGAKVD